MTRLEAMVAHHPLRIFLALWPALLLPLGGCENTAPRTGTLQAIDEGEYPV